MVQLLLKHNAAANALDKRERQAIHWAAYMGHRDIIKLLVDNGVELSCRDKQVPRSGCKRCRLFVLLLSVVLLLSASVFCRLDSCFFRREFLACSRQA